MPSPTLTRTRSPPDQSPDDAEQAHGREHSVLKSNAYGLPDTAANQSPPIALTEPQMLALLAASYPLPAPARAAFLEHCAREIANLPELGDGVCIGRSCACRNSISIRPISVAARCRASASGSVERPHSGFYTFRKSSLSPKARDVTYRQCKSLRILAGCSSAGTMAVVRSPDFLRALNQRDCACNINPPASSYAIMRRAGPYRGENSGPGKDNRGELDTETRN
jgi:hypothetical protein